MAKLIILSILLVSVGVPAWLATKPQPKKALKKAQTIVIVFVVIWAWACLHWYPDLVPLK